MIREAVNVAESGLFNLMKGVAILLLKMHACGEYGNIKTLCGIADSNQRLQLAEIGPRSR